MMKTCEERTAGTRRAVALPLALLLVGLLGSISVAQEEQNPIQVRATATSEAIRIIFSRPGTAPVEPPLDAIVGWATGEMDDVTVSKRALASAIYPGATAARPGGLFGLVGFPIGGQLLPTDHPISELYGSLPDLLPPYPLLVEASSPNSPNGRVDLTGEATGNLPTVLPFAVAGGFQDAAAAPNLTQAETAMTEVTFDNGLTLLPGASDAFAQLQVLLEPIIGESVGLTGSLLEVESVRSEYRSLRHGGESFADTSATNYLSGVQIAGGLVSVGEIASSTLHSGDDQGSELAELEVDMRGLQILGFDFAVDQDGLRLADERIPRALAGVAEELIADSLTEMGVEVTALNVDREAGVADALEVRMQFEEPEVPGVASVGRTTSVTMILGHVAAGQSTTPRPASAVTPSLNRTPGFPTPPAPAAPVQGDAPPTTVPPSGSQSGTAVTFPATSSVSGDSLQTNVQSPVVADPPEVSTGGQDPSRVDGSSQALDAVPVGSLTLAAADVQGLFRWVWVVIVLALLAPRVFRQRHPSTATASFRGDL